MGNLPSIFNSVIMGKTPNDSAWITCKCRRGNATQRLIVLQEFMEWGWIFKGYAAVF